MFNLYTLPLKVDERKNCGNNQNVRSNANSLKNTTMQIHVYPGSHLHSESSHDDRAPGPHCHSASSHGDRARAHFAEVIAYAQGFSLLRAASEEHGWNLRLGELARIWQGCVIRSFVHVIRSLVHSLM